MQLELGLIPETAKETTLYKRSKYIVYYEQYRLCQNAVMRSNILGKYTTEKYCKI